MKKYIASKKILEAGVIIHALVTANENINGRVRHFPLFNSFISFYQMIMDKNIRERCCDCLCQGHSLFCSFLQFLTEGELASSIKKWNT